jgi:hypothetical protein
MLRVHHLKAFLMIGSAQGKKRKDGRQGELGYVEP